MKRFKSGIAAIGILVLPVTLSGCTDPNGRPVPILSVTVHDTRGNDNTLISRTNSAMQGVLDSVHGNPVVNKYGRTFCKNGVQTKTSFLGGKVRSCKP